MVSADFASLDGMSQVRHKGRMYKIIGADNKEYGPITIEQMRQWLTEGRVNAQTLVWSETTNNWKPLAAYPEFASAVPPLSQGAVPPYSPPGVGAGVNKMATWGMAMGICAFVFSCCCYGLPFNVLGIIFSLRGLALAKTDPTAGGRTQAMVGLVLSILSVVIVVVLLIIGVAFNDQILKKVQELGGRGI